MVTRPLDNVCHILGEFWRLFVVHFLSFSHMQIQAIISIVSSALESICWLQTKAQLRVWESIRRKELVSLSFFDMIGSVIFMISTIHMGASKLTYLKYSSIANASTPHVWTTYFIPLQLNPSIVNKSVLRPSISISTLVPSPKMNKQSC